MFKPLLRLGLLLTLCGVVPVAIIRAQRYDDSGLRAYLNPSEGCTAPCFMGVRPGMTSLDEFVTIIAQHQWVADTVRSDYAEMIGRRRIAPNPIMMWEWDTARPDWIDLRQAGVVWVPGARVSVMLIETNIALGDFILTFGEPDWVSLKSVQDDPVIGVSGYEYEYTGWYRDHHIIVSTGGVCSDSHLYQWPVRLFFQAVPDTTGASVALDVCR